MKNMTPGRALFQKKAAPGNRERPGIITAVLCQFSLNCTVTPALTVVIGNDCEVFGTVLR
jgi:hypothetical protein